MKISVDKQKPSVSKAIKNKLPAKKVQIKTSFKSFLDKFDDLKTTQNSNTN